MKRLFYSVFILSAIACSEKEFIPSENKNEIVTKTIETVSNVNSENGYLIVKDFQTLDSLISELEKMTDLERLSWETKMNFESAHTYFDPYFNIFDTITSEKNLQVFKQKYQHVIKITQDGEDWNIDYPFNVENLEFVLSKDGKIKIGSTFWLYKADRKINIHDATEEKIEKYKDTKNTVTSDEVSVYYYAPSRLRDGRESSAEQLKDYSNLPRKDKRGYAASLDILKREYKNDTQINHRRYLALFQQGKKKKALAGYKIYKTQYYVVIFSIKGNNWSYANPIKITSPERKGGTYYMFGYVEGQTFPRFSISANHGTRGYTSAPQIDYTYSGSGNAIPVFEGDNSIGY